MSSGAVLVALLALAMCFSFYVGALYVKSPASASCPMQTAQVVAAPVQYVDPYPNYWQYRSHRRYRHYRE